MINIYIFIIILVVVLNVYLIYDNNTPDVISFISNQEIIIYLDLIIVIYAVHDQYFTVNNINNFTSNINDNIIIDDNNIIINVSDHKSANKIIYWIVNNRTFNGIADIINNKVKIPIKDLDINSKLVLKYRTVSNEKLSEVFSLNLYK